MTTINSRNWRIFFFFSWLGLAMPLFAQDANEQAEAEFRDKITGLVFKDVAGFTRNDVHYYEQEPLGYSVDYQSKSGIRISIYVYDFGFRTIADGPFSEVVRKQIRQARGDIFRAKEQGSYQDVNETWSGIVLLGDEEKSPKASKMAFILRRDDIDFRSELLLTGFKNHFFKVRITFPDEKEAECQKEIKRVVDQLGRMMVAATANEDR